MLKVCTFHTHTQSSPICPEPLTSFCYTASGSQSVTDDDIIAIYFWWCFQQVDRAKWYGREEILGESIRIRKSHVHRPHWGNHGHWLNLPYRVVVKLKRAMGQIFTYRNLDTLKVEGGAGMPQTDTVLKS